MSPPAFLLRSRPGWLRFYRQMVDLGHRCDTVAPSLVPKRAAERVKTNGRDSVSLARLLRAGELKGIWAVRDLVRVRCAASEDLRKKRQQLLLFLEALTARLITTGEETSRTHKAA